MSSWSAGGPWGWIGLIIFVIVLIVLLKFLFQVIMVAPLISHEDMPIMNFILDSKLYL